MKKVIVFNDTFVPVLETNKPVIINQNNTTIEIVPDMGYDAMEKVTALVQVPTANIESNKTYTVPGNNTATSTYEVTPTSGYNAMQKTTLTAKRYSVSTFFDIYVDNNIVGYEVLPRTYPSNDNSISEYQDIGRFYIKNQNEYCGINEAIIRARFQYKTITSNGTYYPQGLSCILSKVVVAIPNPGMDMNALTTLPDNDTYYYIKFDENNWKVKLDDTSTLSTGESLLHTFEVSVPSISSINNYTYPTITSNGTYTIPSGYTGLDDVVVNVPKILTSDHITYGGTAYYFSDFNVGPNDYVTVNSGYTLLRFNHVGNSYTYYSYIVYKITSGSSSFLMGSTVRYLIVNKNSVYSTEFYNDNTKAFEIDKPYPVDSDTYSSTHRFYKNTFNFDFS